MKLLLILPSFNGGGAERVTIHLANGMTRRGHECHFLVLNSGGPLANRVSADVTLHDLHVARLRNGFPKLLRVIRDLRPDVLFSTFAYVNVAVLMARPLLPRTMRVWIREANLPSLSLTSSRSRRFLRLLSRKYYPAADLTIATSSRMRDEFRSDFALPEKKIRTLYNPVDVASIRAELSAQQTGRETGRRYVASGRLTAQKGFDRLLTAFADPVFGGDELLVLGEGRMAQQLRQQSLREQTADRVDFKGFVADPWQTYAGSDAFVMPSLWEGMPNAALEALACGTPVIATPQSGGIAEVEAAADPGAVTVVEFGDGFTSAMKQVPRPSAGVSGLKPSLLPAAFELDTVLDRFESWL